MKISSYMNNMKYKIAVTVMELRFWLKDCELPI